MYEGGTINSVELEKKIEELNGRLEKLENIEKRRKTRLIIKIVLYVIILVILVILGIKLYCYVNNNIIKPINNIKNIKFINEINGLFER